MALAASETSIRKPIAKMKPIDRIRVRSQAHHPATFSLLGVSQIRFKSSCSSAKTDVAPMIRTTMPTTVPAMLVDGVETLLSIACTASAPALPISPWSWATMESRAASWPKTSPATEIAISRSGAIENTV